MQKVLVFVFLSVFSLSVFAGVPSQWDWPFKRENIQIMNTISTLQFYGPKSGFHHGVDLLANGVEDTYAPVAGKVSTGYYYKRKSRYTYEIAIELDNGYRLELHHIDRDSVPENIEALAKSGGIIEKGMYLGKIYDSSDRGIPPHLHINWINPEGYYENALKMLPRFEDNSAPVVNGAYLVEQAGSNLRQISNSSVTSDNSKFLLVDAFDRVNSNAQKLSIHRLRISKLSKAGNSIVSDINFDKLPKKSFLEGTEIYLTQKMMINNIEFVPGNMNEINSRRFMYQIEIPQMKSNDSSNQDYQIQVWDFSGNQTSVMYSDL